MAHFIDWLLGLLTPAQWDSWRNWLATIGGLVALSIALATYVRNVRIKREEQARLVYSKTTHVAMRNTGDKFPLLPNGAQMGIGSAGLKINTAPDGKGGWTSEAEALTSLLQVTVIVHNGSKELIGPVRVGLVLTTGMRVDSIGVSEVEPETDYVADFTWISPAGTIPGLDTTIIFRDSSARWWRRYRSRPIEHVHNDPENELMPFEEREQARARQKAMGIPENLWVQEPKVPLRARWHRFWRARRGKSPIP